jgi:type I restriction enzyme S subunit
MIPRNRRHHRYVLSTSHVKARLDANRALPEYYYYYFRSPQGQHELLKNVSTVGVPGLAQPVATIKSLQRAVASVLSALDDKIAVNGRTTETYEKLLSAQFDELRIDIDPEPSSAVVTSQLIDFNPKLRIPRESDSVYLDMASVPTDMAMVTEWSRREPKSGTRFSNGDTVMARITPCLENGKAAFIDFMKDGEVGIGSTEFIVMRARPGTPIQLPYFLARSPRFRSYAIQNMIGSSGRQRVHVTQLVDFPISRPDSGKLSAFGADASKAFAHMRSLADQSGNLSELRDTLLPKLMSGEIRVRDAEKVAEDVT